MKASVKILSLAIGAVALSAAAADVTIERPSIKWLFGGLSQAWRE